MGENSPRNRYLFHWYLSRKFKMAMLFLGYHILPQLKKAEESAQAPRWGVRSTIYCHKISVLYHNIIVITLISSNRNRGTLLEFGSLLSWKDCHIFIVQVAKEITLAMMVMVHSGRRSMKQIASHLSNVLVVMQALSNAANAKQTWLIPIAIRDRGGLPLPS